MSKITTVAKNVGGFISKNSPTILTSLSVGGLLTTTILAVKATPKAIVLIEKDSRLKHDGDPYAYTKKEAVKSAWKCYIPSASIGVVSIVCIISANHISLRRNAALASIYTITETALKEYQDKVVETVGAVKEAKILDDLSADHIQKNPPKENEIIFTGKGEVLCYDTLSGRYFKSDLEKLREAVNDVNEDLLNDGYISLNDFYYRLGLSETVLGNEMGWHIEKGKLEVHYSSLLSQDGEPCISMNYAIKPKFI